MGLGVGVGSKKSPVFAPYSLSPGFPFGQSQAGARRPPGLQGAHTAAEQPPGCGQDCAVMITAETVDESAVSPVPEAAAARGDPELEEPTWPWVSPDPSRNGSGQVVQARECWLHAQPCFPLHRKMPRSGRWCSASTSCRLNVRRPSAAWKSKCQRRSEQGSQGSVPCLLCRWACWGRSWLLV